MTIGQRPNAKGDKIYFFYDNGRGKGNRPSANVWIWASPKNQEQKNHNREALKIIEVKKSQATIEQQAIGTPVIPAHKFRNNFIDYFEDYMNLNKRDGNRHLSCCLSKLKLFVGGSFLAPINVTENFCKRFQAVFAGQPDWRIPGQLFCPVQMGGRCRQA